MEKKIIMALPALLLLATISLAVAQQTAKVPRIGYLASLSEDSDIARREAFQHGLKELGYIEEKNVAETIGSVADSFVHVHISENDRGTPGTGHVQWDETFRALRKAKYDNWLVIESFGRALPALAAATKVWRDLFPAAEEVYTQGLRFMKEKWSAARI